MVNVISLSILAFAAAAGILTITPGPDTAMVLRSSATQGPRAGIAAGVGICAGLLLWGLGAALGLTAFLAASVIAYTLLKWLGAAYLVYLGLKLLLKPRSTLAADTDLTVGSTGASGAGDALRRGFLSNILNPKIGVFYVTFLPQFVPHGVSVAGFSMLLAIIHVLLTCIWFAFLITLTVPLGQVLRRPRVIKGLDRLTGCVFVAFGAKLAVTKAA